MIEASEEVYALIGRISMGMERIHHRITRLISNICSRNEVSSQLEQALTATTSLRQSVNLLEMIYLNLSKNQESRCEFRDIIKKIRTLEEIRNSTIHAIWIPTESDDKFLKWKFTKDKNSGIKFSGDELDFKKLTEVANECFKLEKELIHFLFRDVKRGHSPFNIHNANQSQPTT